MAKAPSKIMTIAEKKGAIAIGKAALVSATAENKTLDKTFKADEAGFKIQLVDIATSVKEAAKVRDAAVKNAEKAMKAIHKAYDDAVKSAEVRTKAIDKAMAQAHTKHEKAKAAVTALSAKLSTQLAATQAAPTAEPEKPMKTPKATKIPALPSGQSDLFANAA